MNDASGDILDDAENELIYRASGADTAPPVLYLPGVHGDWTPQAVAGPLLAERFRLVEVAYPKQPEWAIVDHVQAVVALLDRLEIASAHIIAESFGSLVGWELGLEHSSRVRSLMIVGGFCQPPGPPKVLLAKWGLSILPTELFERGVDAYASIKKLRGRLSPSELEGGPPYTAVRSDLGRNATVQRLELISRLDFRHHLHDLQVPVRYIAGELDRIVSVEREIETLREILPAETGFESRVIPGAPHMIIASHPKETAAQLIAWIGALEGEPVEEG